MIPLSVKGDGTNFVIKHVFLNEEMKVAAFWTDEILDHCAIIQLVTDDDKVWVESSLEILPRLHLFKLEDLQVARLKQYVSTMPLLYPSQDTSYMDVINTSAECNSNIAWIVSEMFSKWLEVSDQGVINWLHSCRAGHDDPVNRILRDRADLFEEFSKTVSAKPIVFIVGGHCSGITEFFDGFRTFVKFRKQGFDIGASFSHDTLSEILAFTKKLGDAHESLKDDNYSLNAILATLAYSAATELVYGHGDRSLGRRQKTQTFSITKESLQSPATFAFLYLYQTAFEGAGCAYSLKSNASCLTHFMQFLSAASSSVSNETVFKVFLPFNELARLLVDERQTSDIQLVDYYRPAVTLVETLSKIKKEDQDKYKDIGVIIQLHQLIPELCTRAFMIESVLAVPALRKTEILLLVRRFYESADEKAVTECVNLLEDETSGEPEYLRWVFECLKLKNGKNPYESMSEAIKDTKKFIESSIAPSSAENLLVDTPVQVAIKNFISTARVLKTADFTPDLLSCWRNPVASVNEKDFLQAQKWIKVGLARLNSESNGRTPHLYASKTWPRYNLGKASKIGMEVAKAISKSSSGS